MNKVLVCFFSLFLFAITSISAQGYKSHKVVKGETVKSIAEKYNIEPADIYKFNPEVQNGVKENVILIIPLKQTETPSNVNPLDGATEVSFKEHKVRRKETLFSLSQEYNVSVDDLKKYNNELYSRELKKGEVLQIPVYKKSIVQQTLEEQPVVNEHGQKLEKYIVQKSEGLYRIAVNHSVSVEAIQKLNPNMKADALKEGDTILIPTQEPKENLADEFDFYTVQQGEGFFRIKENTGYTQEIIEKLNPEVALNGLKPGMILKLPKKVAAQPFHPVLGVPYTNLLDSIRAKEVKLALVLPFKTQGMSIDSVPYMVNELKTNKLLNVSLDFYSGVLKAVDSLEEQGLTVHLKVLDSQGDETVVQQLVREGAFDDVQAVIGPLYNAAFNRLANELYVKGIPLFSPLSNKNLKQFANVFSTVPTDEDLSRSLLSYVKAHELDYNIIVFADDEHVASQNRIKEVFPDAKIINKDVITVNGMKAVLSLTKKNLVFVETNNIPLLTNVTNILNTLVSDEVSIQLTTTVKTDAFNADSVKNEYLNNLNFLYATVDKSSSLNLSFAKNYHEEYGKFPDRLVVRGFDIAMDVALRVAYTATLTNEVTPILGETVYIENKFYYLSSPQGYFANNAVYVVMYKDMEIIEAP
ncbi:amino acid ABC transporter substrate-binding protein [Neptunitalea lumnitzerae]|uniref:LysM domain-containing protein n=1 Tax=Neptunitalea lumnitzerae TaxID=2965509 RepID=A0ABQ5MMB1_9FLAO|nr:LysM peptidoglycan-binding domain-containing protein [Neptunitalea sp. Y10]GLB50509.1 hypothetical protein Y10_28770 [Neptunitalea sp. Y10]